MITVIQNIIITDVIGSYRHFYMDTLLGKWKTFSNYHWMPVNHIFIVILDIIICYGETSLHEIKILCYEEMTTKIVE